MWIIWLAIASAQEIPPSFGADVSAGYAVGAVLGDWPVPGPHGAWTVRYDAFIQGRDTQGPRVGISIFGGASAWPVQEREEILDDGLDSTERGPMAFTHFGVLGVIRFDPAAPVGGVFGIGFSRMDFEDYYEGALSVPTFVIEGGARQRLGPDGPLYLDYTLRTGWGAARGPTDPTTLTDWWTAQAVLALGVHLR